MFAALLALACSVVVAVYFTEAFTKAGAFTLVDFEVYRGAVRSWLAGDGLYSFSYPLPNGEAPLPFTYPPFAAVLFAPLALLPAPIARPIWVGASLAICPVLAWLVLRQAPGARRKPVLSSLVVGALAVMTLLLSVPVAHSILLGQVSLLLVVATLADLTGVVPRKWRGVLVGLAGAVKLIPLVFIPYYLVTRQWRAARNAAVSFALATALGALVLPAESAHYWTSLVFDATRVGEVAVSRNKSLLGLLTRWDLGGDGQQVLWLILAAVIALVALWRASRHHQRGEEFAAALVIGALSIVLTPISWPHHQVWLPVAGLYLILLRRRWPVIAGVLLLAAVVVGSPLFSMAETGPLWLRLAWEIPTLLAIAISLFGLPARESAPAIRPAVAEAQLVTVED